MRLKIASMLLLAGTVVGCASNPPPPPPMAATAPEPAPAPAPPPPMAPVSGTYRGMAESSSDGGRACRAPRGTQTARVRNNNITVAGLRGRIGSDGTVTGRGLSGTVNGGTADLNVTRGHCSYHYTLNNGAGGAMNSGSEMNSMGGNSSMGGSGIGGSNTGAGSEGGPGMSGGGSTMHRGM